MELKTIGRFGIFISIVFLIVSPKLALSEFIGPINVIEGSLGDTNSEFTLYHDDMGDSVPGLRCINSSGNMVIPDCVKKQVKIYSNKGVVLSTITPKNVKINYTWPGFVGCDSENNIYTSNWDNKLQKYSSGGKLFWEKEVIVSRIAVQPDDTIIIWGYRPHMKGKEKFVQYSPTGQLLETYKERPLELGVVKKLRKAEGYIYIIQYPDLADSRNTKTYMLKLPGYIEKFKRYMNGYLYATALSPGEHTNDSIFRYDPCKESITKMQIPDSQYNITYITDKPHPIGYETEVIVEYGKPVIAPNGDVYTWKRTKDTYSIIKWIWIESRDAPVNLKASVSENKIFLSWEKPTQDAVTVKAYEIYRSSGVCGPFNKLKKVKKGVLQYTDKEVEEGETYYYQVCAERGSGYSGYSNKAVGSIKD